VVVGIAMVAKVKAYFLSDLHLSTCQDAKGTRFVRFLRDLDCEQVTHLFLVGDVFDLWLGQHNYFLQKFAPIISEIRRLKERGLEIHYFEGNHDLYLNLFWGGVLGVHVHEGPLTINLGEWKVRIEHGDQIDREDRGYLALRWFLRLGFVRWCLCHAPSSWVARVGDRISRASRYYTSQVKHSSQSGVLNKVRAHAQQISEKEKVDYVITGHIHVVDEWDVGSTKQKTLSINLGSWLEQPKYFELSQQGGRFHSLES
jgi:UDP-2,3-diacylglucosamine hydrolase